MNWMDIPPVSYTHLGFMKENIFPVRNGRGNLKRALKRTGFGALFAAPCLLLPAKCSPSSEMCIRDSNRIFIKFPPID